MIAAHLWRQFQISTKKCCAQLGNKFLARISFIPPFLAPKFTIKTALVLRPVRELMRQCCIVRFRTTKRFEMWHLHMITAACVVGRVAAVPDISAGVTKKLFGMIDLQSWINDRLGLSIVVFRQAFDLIDIENAIAFHKRNFPLFVLPVLALLGLGDSVGVHPLLMVTDPPYGVEYDPSWRNQAGAAKTKRTGKVLNDDRADWREAWALFPGDVAYV